MENSQIQPVSQVCVQYPSLGTAKESVRYRAACDRCHGKKIRCRKAPGAKNCIECTKHTIDCRFAIFRKDIKRSCSLSRKRKMPVESQLTGLQDQIKASREETFPPTLVGESMEVGKSPVSANPETELETQTQWQPSLDLADHNWNYNNVSSCQDIAVDTSFEILDFEDFLNPPRAAQASVAQASCPQNMFDQSDLLLSNYLDPPDTPHLNLTQRRDEPVPILDASYHRSKNNLSPLRMPSFLSRYDNKRSQVEIPLEPPPAVPPKEQLPSQLRRNWHIGSNNRVNDVCNMSEGDIFKALNKLSLDLYKHKAVIPPQSIYVPQFADDPVIRPCHEQYKSYSVDDTFQLTQNLVDLYPRFIETFLEKHSVTPSKPNSEDMFPKSVSNSKAYGYTVTQPGKPIQEVSALTSAASNYSSVLLLISCHTCLNEIYEEMFQHMDRCIESMGATNEEPFVAPVLRIGNYAPPPSVAVPMQILLIVQLASQLSDYAETLVACLEETRREFESRHAGHLERGINVDKMSVSGAKTVKARANVIFQKLAELRRTSLDGGFFT